MFIESTIKALPTRGQKQVLKSLIGYLNASIIGYARAHIKASTIELKSEAGYLVERPDHIDNYDVVRLQEQAEKERNKFMENTGLTIQVKPIEIFEKVVDLRQMLEAMLVTTEDFNPLYDSAYGVINSLTFQIQRAPQEDISALEKLAQATGIDVERLKAANGANNESSKKQLVNDAAAIVALYDDRTGISNTDLNSAIKKGMTREEALEEMGIDIHTVDALFQTLPIHVKYKIGIKLYDAMKTASDRAVELMLRPQRGAREAAADVKIIDALIEEFHPQLVAFDKRYADELDAASERSSIPELPELVRHEVAVAMDKQSEKESSKLKSLDDHIAAQTA